jgi:hypothetical protein
VGTTNARKGRCPFKKGAGEISTKMAEQQISKIAGVLIERLGIAINIARRTKDDGLFDKIDTVLRKEIQVMDEATMLKNVHELELLIDGEISCADDEVAPDTPLSQVDALVAQAAAVARFQATGDAQHAEEASRLARISRLEIGPHGDLQFDATFMTHVCTENTGGGSMCDFIFRKDGRVLAMNDESVAIYESKDSFYAEGEVENTPLHFMWIEPSYIYALRSAHSVRTSDGYTLTRQTDGSWSDGDMVFATFEEMVNTCKGHHLTAVAAPQ